MSATTQGRLTRTELLCLAFGWQGGTVHQVAKKTGLTVQQIVDGITRNNNGDETGGYFAFRTCSLEYREQILYPKHQGNLDFWQGVARAVEISLHLGDLSERTAKCHQGEAVGESAEGEVPPAIARADKAGEESASPAVAKNA